MVEKFLRWAPIQIANVTRIGFLSQALGRERT